MKKLAIAFAMLIAVSASAATCWMNANTQRILWDGRPGVVTIDGTTFQDPNDALLAAAGWVEVEYADGTEFNNRVWGWEPAPWCRAMTPAEMAARDEADAAAASNAAAQAALPATFATGIAVTNSASHWVEFIPDGTSVVAQTLAVQISQSPLTPEQRNAMRAAALASEQEARAAWLAAMAVLKTNLKVAVSDSQAISALTSNFTSAQCRATVNDIRRELVDLAQEVKALRKQLAKYGKLDDE